MLIPLGLGERLPKLPIYTLTISTLLIVVFFSVDYSSDINEALGQVEKIWHDKLAKTFVIKALGDRSRLNHLPIITSKETQCAQQIQLKSKAEPTLVK